jgi:hypothetical protein
MDLLEIILGRSVRLFRMSHPRGGVYLPTLLNAVRGRYGFIKMPEKIEELDASKGIEFAHGLYKENVIDKLVVYYNGVLVEGKFTTDISDMILEDVISWATQDLGYSIIPDATNKPPLYYSQLEIRLKNGPSSISERLSEFANIITDTVHSYAAFKDKGMPSYEPTKISFNYDLVLVPPPRPLEFIIERRAERPFYDNVYFGSAGMRTIDHLETLQKFEQLFS